MGRLLNQLEDPAERSGSPAIGRPLTPNCSALDNGGRDEYYPFMLPRVIRRCGILLLAFAFLLSLNSFASEADLNIPDLKTVTFDVQGNSVNGMLLLYIGLGVCVLGILFGWIQY